MANKGLEPISEALKARIVANVLKACQDITKLNRTGYNYLYLCSGFIAHYGLGGFIDHYSQQFFNLSADILFYERANVWDNFHPGEENYEYYQSRADVYRRIVQGLKGA